MLDMDILYANIESEDAAQAHEHPRILPHILSYRPPTFLCADTVFLSLASIFLTPEAHMTPPTSPILSSDPQHHFENLPIIMLTHTVTLSSPSFLLHPCVQRLLNRSPYFHRRSIRLIYLLPCITHNRDFISLVHSPLAGAWGSGRSRIGSPPEL